MSLPHHIAIMPDGNRRWAKERKLPAFLGHREGAKTTEKIFKAAFEANISYLTFWGASINNILKREEKEVRFLFKLFGTYFKKLADSAFIHKNQVRVRALGLWKKYFPPDVKKAIEKLVKTTEKYNKFNLTFLLAYNGTEEMVAAVQNIVGAIHELPLQAGKPTVSPETIKNHLYTKDLPAVDLAIRTGGEPHLSTGFMMWDLADAQLYFSDSLWPDFSAQEFEKALTFYQKTHRRLGK